MDAILGDILLDPTPIVLLSAGLLMGLLHVFEPDHMATMMSMMQNKRSEYDKISTSSIKRRMIIKNSILGAFWGLGHTSTIILVGVLVFALSFTIPESVFGWFEVAAGIMIILLGITVIVRRSFGHVHSHPHLHKDGTIHTHPHNDAGEHLHSHRSYLIGCVHGLAGSGILITLGILTAGTVDAFLYFVIMFGVGSVTSMMVVSGFMSIPLSVVGRTRRATLVTSTVTGIVSIALGVWIIYGVVTVMPPGA